MKKFALVLLFSILIISCKKEVKKNEEAKETTLTETAKADERIPADVLDMTVSGPECNDGAHATEHFLFT